IYLLSERFDAATAERIGLVANVFDDVDLMVRARAAAERAANFAPLTVAAMKESFNDSAGERSFSAYLDREADRFTRVLGTQAAPTSRAANHFAASTPIPACSNGMGVPVSSAKKKSRKPVRMRTMSPDEISTPWEARHASSSSPVMMCPSSSQSTLWWCGRSS